MTDTWKRGLAAFFAERGEQVDAVPTLEDLCYVSGRDSRLWLQPDIYDDLMTSIVSVIAADHTSQVLEVGCASGFLAKGVAPRVGRYVGVDLAKPALRVAERLQLPNASFQTADGNRLPFDDGRFHSAYCYDVFTNFPQIADGAGIIREMLRVVRPGGRVLVGSIPDAATVEAYEARVAEVSRQLQDTLGPPPPPRLAAGPVSPGRFGRLRRIVSPPVVPHIHCYYFHRRDFVELGEELGAQVEISDIHARNPYAGFRFNAVYTKSA